MSGVVRSRRRPVARPPRHDQADTRRTAGRSGALLQLQRTAGNRAVGRLVVQRAPLGEYGLDTPASESKYVTEAARLWKSQKAMAPKAFAEALLTLVVGDLKGYGVPPFTWKFESIGASGIFDSEHWIVKVDVGKFTANGRTVSRIGDLSLAEVTAVVGTLYHESRHADQDVLIIRQLLDAKQKVPDIIATTKIRADIVKTVDATTYADPLDAAEVAHAKRMFDVMYGTHRQFLQFLIANTAAFDGIGSLGLRGSNLAAAAPHVTAFTAWQSSELQPKVDAMGKAKGLSPMEQGHLADLRAMNTAILALATAWNAVPDKAKPRAKVAATVRTKAAAAEHAVANAYRNLEGEKDAFRLEGEIAGAFDKAARKK